MKHSNISIFVPHAGCPHQCSFCDQRTISGEGNIPHADDVRRICTRALDQINEPENAEIAFFGGSFTAIPRSYMAELLEAAQDFIGKGKFRGIRISTRPDYIDDEVLSLLKSSGVTAIELGAQSMDEEVLEANERGHSSQDVVNASRLIKKYGFELGLQMMTGLYRSTPEKDAETFERLRKLYPDTMRIYPVVILNGTRLGELFKSGEYVPYSFDEGVELCSQIMERAEHNGIKLIKVGLHASEFVEGELLGGFYHPAFRELCEGRIYLRELKTLARGHSYLEVSVPERNLSKALGQKRCNAEELKRLGTELKIIADKTQKERIKLISRR